MFDYSANSIQVIGNIGTIELTDVGSTKKIRLSIAENFSYKKGDKRIDDSQWHSVEFWAAHAETISKYFKKGDKVWIQGMIRYEEWESEDGQKKTATKIRGEKIQMVAKKNDEAKSEEVAEPAEAPANSSERPF